MMRDSREMMNRCSSVKNDSPDKTINLIHTVLIGTGIIIIKQAENAGGKNCQLC